MNRNHITIIIMINFRFSSLSQGFRLSAEIVKEKAIRSMEADEIGHLGWLRYVSHFGAGLP